ncbi:MAG: hypothetical protein BMS9Abin20_0790 [Acidimicrobiia bacterium]|nr:MAG: hypothetical protein BMS9Abin20_0790 [Acidimicrobiia bacterium]
MWRKLIVVGTIAVTLFAGTALAVASQGMPGAPATSDDAQTDHWSEMETEMGDVWPEMVGHMQDVLGDGFPDMVTHMQSFSLGMGRSDMGGSDMRDAWSGLKG